MDLERWLKWMEQDTRQRHYLWIRTRTQGWQEKLGHLQTNFAPLPRYTRLLHLWWLSCAEFTESFRPSGHRQVQPLGHPADVRNREQGDCRLFISRPGCLPARSCQLALSPDTVLTCSEWPAVPVPPSTCWNCSPLLTAWGPGGAVWDATKPLPFPPGVPYTPPSWIKPHPVTLVEAPSSFLLGPQLT